MELRHRVLVLGRGRFPGRVGGGVGIGGLEADFALAEIPWEEKLARFKVAFPAFASALRGEADAVYFVGDLFDFLVPLCLF